MTNCQSGNGLKEAVWLLPTGIGAVLPGYQHGIAGVLRWV